MRAGVSRGDETAVVTRGPVHRREMSAAARVSAARDAERRRIEQNLHDGAQQRLTAVRLGLGMVAELMGTAPGAARRKLEQVRRELDDALEELRDLAHGLYPGLLESDGLPAALAAAARRSPIPVSVETHGLRAIPRPIESAAYFCCLEALQNVAKHAGGRATAAMRVTAEDGWLEFDVTDNGRGFEPEGTVDGYGLSSMRDRVLAFGGCVEVTSDPGRGTTVAGRIPLRAPALAL